jgi:O-antigen ligase
MIFAVILLNLSRLHIHLGIGQFRPVVILVLISLILAIMKPGLVNTAALFRYWPSRVIAALGVLACLSAVFGISLGGTGEFILRVYLKVLLLGFLLIVAVKSARDLATFVWAYVISCGVLTYFGVFFFDVRPDSGAIRLDNLYTFDANDIAAILMSGLPLTLLVFQNSRGSKKLMAGLILLGIGATMARSGSRGGFLAFMALGTALMFWTPGVTAMKRILFVGAAAIALAVAAPPGYWERMMTLTQPTQDYNWSSYYGRKQLAERGIGYMLQYPLFGVGAGQFPRADYTMSDRARSFVDEPGLANRWRAVHNSYVQVGAEMGVPGLVLWSALLFGGIASMRRLRRRLPPGWMRGDPDQRLIYYMTIYLPVSLVGFGVAAFFVSFAYVDVFYILVAYVVAVHISLSVWERERHHPMRPQPQTVRPRVYPGLVARSSVLPAARE